jgi:enoyl-CoA hydratase/carnithine racemase
MEFVKLSVEEGIAELRLERAPVNAIEDRVVDELAASLRQIGRDEAVRATVLTASGKFFSFGFDIPRFLAYSKEAFSEYLTRFTTLYRELFGHPKPIVAALNGHAVAAGCMLATACDARIMVRGKARIGLNEIGFGSSVFAGSAGMLAFWVGPRRAQEILYGARLYSAEEAAGLGLVDAVADESELLAAARQIAAGHAARDPAAFASVKMLLRRPVIEEMIAREATSVREFADIWYAERTWKNLKEIKIRG